MEKRRNFVGKYYRYPDLTGRRQCEGGRRIYDKKQPISATIQKVTIITVSKNSELTIEDCIKSVLSQTYQNIEHIIIDGLSTDRTTEIIKKYRFLIDYYVSEPDNGIYDAMNKGIELASGDLIIILNSDDWYEANAISMLVSTLNYSKCDFVGSLIRCINSDGTSHILPRMSFDKSTLLRMPIRHGTLLISSDIYNRIGPYDISYKIIADYEFCIRLYRSNMTYYENPYPLLNFRTTGVSSVNLKILHREHTKLLLNIFPFLTPSEAKLLGNHSTVQPNDFITIANRYTNQQEFVISVKAILQDFKRVRGGIWGKTEAENISKGLMSRYPKISIIMPIYKYYSSLWDDINSVLKQDFNGIELICVYNKNSYMISSTLESISSYDDRLKSFECKSIFSRGKLKNVGIRAASGEYLFFFEKNGRIPDGILRLLYDTARIHDSSVVRGALCFEKINEEYTYNVVDYPADINDNLVPNVAFEQIPALLGPKDSYLAGLYERNFAESILFPERFLSGEDRVFLARILSNAHTVTVFPYIVYVIREEFKRRRALEKLNSHAGTSLLALKDFMPVNKYVARSKLKLRCDRRYIAIGGVVQNYTRDERMMLENSISMLISNGMFDNVEVICIGDTKYQLEVPIHNMEYPSDPADRSLIYAAADVFVYPSVCDGAPLEAAEALLSGTPVICFSCVDIANVIRHRETGFIINSMDLAYFSQAISWAILDATSSNSILRSVKCHLDACKIYQPRIIL